MRLSMRGLRGGVGTTSLLAALGLALHRQGQRVLLVEISPENLLGLHFNLPFAETAGWARADIDGSDWRDAAFAVQRGLAILPYGRLDEAEVARIETDSARTPKRWAERAQWLAGDYDWLLFDLPARLPGHADAIDAELPLRLLNVDPACHALLARGDADGSGERWLVNRHDPAIPLQADLMHLWRQDYAEKLLPLVVYEDAAVPAALARKRPLGWVDVGSLAAADIESLALWCLAQAAARRLA